MPEYDNTNRGALFKNDKSGNENAPDYKGNLNIDGTDYWLSGWIKKSKKSGMTFMSMSVQPKEAKAKPKTPEQKHEEFNDEISF